MKLTLTTLVGILILSLQSVDTFAQPCANCRTQVQTNIDNSNTPDLTVNTFSLSGTASASKTVTLNWLTVSETNVDHFEIERSFNGVDFANAGLSLDGFENGKEKNYAFRDNSSLLKEQGKTISYYRLKQISADGKVVYSNIISVRLVAGEIIAG